MNANRITLRSVVLGMMASGLFAWYTVIMENSGGKNPPILTATQIPVMPFLLLILFVLVVNPVLRRIRFIRRLSTAEVMLIFIMTMVSSGVSTFGLASQLVPAVSGLFNRNWNTAQVRWDRHIEPFVSESFFVAEPGIQQLAAVARSAEDAWRGMDGILQTARTIEDARQVAGELQKQLSNEETPVGAAARVQLTRQLDLEHGRIAQAEEQWARYTQQKTLDINDVLRACPERVAALLAEYEARRAALAVQEERAFASIDEFRKGLPDDLRAVPGLLPTADEGLQLYRTRLRRLRAGIAAAGLIEAAREALDAGRDADARAALRRAAQRLEPVADRTALDAQRADLVNRRTTLEPQLTEARAELEALRASRRSAHADAFADLDKRIQSANTEGARIEAEIAAITREIDGTVDPCLRLTTEIADVRAAILDIASEWVSGSDPETLGAELAHLSSELERRSISWRAMFAGAVPWRVWLRPLANWALLIIATYTMLMTLNVLIFRQWAHNEKLSYPLAELPLLLSGAGDLSTSDGRVPSIYRSGMFWTGFAISAFTMGWNIMAVRQVMPGLKPIPLRWAWNSYVEGSVFSGLAGGHHQVFFTMIGLAFLVPARISKSLWGFHLIYMGLLLILVWFGYGANMSSFPGNMTMVLNFRSGIGGGALVAFSAMAMWTCRRYMLCAAFPGAVAGLEQAERRELRLSSMMFLLSSALIIGLLSFAMGTNIWFTLFCYLVIVIVTIGMTRGVAEGGLLVFQCHFTPFHIIRSTFGMNRAWTSVSLFAPLVVFYYVFFWDLKTFIAPAMANAMKIRDSLSLRRVGFHMSIWLGLGVAVAVAVATHIIFGYEHGANTMHGWFHAAGPRQLFDSITQMAVSNPVDTTGGLYWMLAGVAIMTGLLFIRRHRSGGLHPLGLVMWVYPYMWSLWFSIFLGWTFKSLVTRYGDRSTYQRFRELFIGLIAGELLMCLFGIDLNRW